MDDSENPQSIDHLATLVTDGEHERAAEYLKRARVWGDDDRKQLLRTLRTLADEQSAAFDGVVPSLTPFLEDEERSVRLTAAKLLVALADADPGSVQPVVPSLADRLADEDEFYYVRARCAEALGYVALEHPDAVGSPEILADLRIGLSFDGPEVRQKLATALECVAVGNPDRLRHQVSTLAEHLGSELPSGSEPDDDASQENELIRYHLVTALVAVGTEHPGRLTEAREALADALTDKNEYVRGRAAEALGLLAHADSEEAVDAETLRAAETEDESTFVTKRVRFAIATDGDSDVPEKLGTVAGIRETTDDAIEAITSPDRECPHCGFALPEDGPAMCPGCGAPY